MLARLATLSLEYSGDWDNPKLVPPLVLWSTYNFMLSEYSSPGSKPHCSFLLSSPFCIPSHIRSLFQYHRLLQGPFPPTPTSAGAKILEYTSAPGASCLTKASPPSLYFQHLPPPLEASDSGRGRPTIFSFHLLG